MYQKRQKLLCVDHACQQGRESVSPLRKAHLLACLHACTLDERVPETLVICPYLLRKPSEAPDPSEPPAVGVVRLSHGLVLDAENGQL